MLLSINAVNDMYRCYGCMHECACMHVCMYVCMYVCINVYVCMYMPTRTDSFELDVCVGHCKVTIRCTYFHSIALMYVCMYVCIYLCMNICTYVCMYACMYVGYAMVKFICGYSLNRCKFK